MSIDFGWNVATALAGWLQQAISAAKNRRQQRFAHIIGNAGVLVSGLRAIDREIYRLFLPLRYFDPKSWSEEKRTEWAEKILALAHEDVILPRMRSADAALASIEGEEDDIEVVRLIRKVRLVSSGGPEDGNIFSNISSTGDLLQNAIMTIDLDLANSMPRISEALLGQDAEALSAVRFMAATLVGWGEDYRGLRFLADDKEQAFGYLMGHQQRVFPALPAPTWVWEG